MDHSLPRRAHEGHPRARRGFAARLLRAVYRLLEQARQRGALAQLSDARLRDIGLTRDDVARETAKPFWRT